MIEPVDCAFNQVMRLFHDEERERAAAWTALESIAVERFAMVRRFTYHGVRQYESFDDFASHFASRSFNSLYNESDVRAPAVREAFHRLAGPDLTFQSPRNAMYLHGLQKDRTTHPIAK